MSKRFLLVLVMWACGCSTPDVGSGAVAIVGGRVETGYDAVGALVLDEPGTFASFCTATLIHPRWVVTAGHCWAITGYAPSRVSFFVGDSVSRTGGTAYRVESVYTPPGYEPADPLVNDVALVMLTTPVGGIAPLPYSTAALSTGEDWGRALTWVGFGENDGVAHTGSGLKRRVTGTMQQVAATEYIHTSGTCQGDSGGPAFSDFGAGEVLVGVVSGTTSNCQGSGIDTRVDAFAAWISETIAAHTPCDFTGGDCGTDACWALTNGETRCFPTDGLGALAACDPTSDRLGCADGYGCGALRTATEGVCLRTCATAQGCTDGSRCDAFDSVPGLGLCVPGFCLDAADCDAGEQCAPLASRPGVGICEACPDADGDGSCASVDCNDQAPAIHLGAAEVCDDVVDNDCNGLADALDPSCATTPSDAGSAGDAGAAADGGDRPALRGRGGCAVSPARDEPATWALLVMIASALRRARRR